MRPAFLSALAVLLFAAFGARAQIYKCRDANGKVTYSQTACAGSGQLLDGHHPSSAPLRELTQRRQVERARQLQQLGAPSPAPAVIPGAQAQGCLDEQGVRNVEAAATSIRLHALDREVHAEQIRRAKACEPLMSDDEMRAFKEQVRARRRASRPVTIMCDHVGCNGSDGSHYTPAAGGNLIRQDGTFCVRTGMTAQCN
jgi:hypothetical protein